MPKPLVIVFPRVLLMVHSLEHGSATIFAHSFPGCYLSFSKFSNFHPKEHRAWFIKSPSKGLSVTIFLDEVFIRYSILLVA
ncbi:hypothetical protein EDB87DRAFT_579940 [Lactarius vividus]|nr:hypothetical protein EDB87DRAFT_579940 [Lactarius vividus]